MQALHVSDFEYENNMLEALYTYLWVTYMLKTLNSQNLLGKQLLDSFSCDSVI
jgi:hypothetical protein